MKLIVPPERLGFAEFAFALGTSFLLLLATFALLDSFGPGRLPESDPYYLYVVNPGIRNIAVLAFGFNLLTLWSLASLRLKRSDKRGIMWVLLFCCLISAALPWVELWWGTTFRYGEHRDKQGLPYSTAHIGPIGTTFFCTYLLTWLRPPLENRVLRAFVQLVIVTAAGVGIWSIQMRVLDRVVDLWSFRSS